VLAGIPATTAWVRPRAGTVVEVVERLASLAATTVVDLASPLEGSADERPGRFDTARAVLARADAVVAVGDATPVGVSRLVGVLAELTRVARTAPVVAVLNRLRPGAPSSHDLVRVVEDSAPVLACVGVRDDRRVTAAAWEGHVVPDGPFTRAVDGVVDAVMAALQVGACDRETA
jgi:hypothetical protein